MGEVAKVSWRLSWNLKNEAVEGKQRRDPGETTEGTSELEELEGTA